MNYLLEYLKGNAKFEALKEDKTSLEHFIGSIISFDKEIAITKISSETREYIPRKGSTIELMVYTPKGVYSIDCKVLEKLDDGYKLSFPETVRLSQRREHLRVDYNGKIKVKCNVEGSEIEFEGNIENICAGGVAFDSQYRIQDGVDTEVEFEFEERKITTKGRIAFCTPITSRDKLYRTGMIMTSLSSDDAQCVMDYCSKFIGKI